MIRGKARYNIVLLGKSGVGKSTLINELLGKEVAKTGVGRPVTEFGFHQYEDDSGAVPITLFDSGGLEAGKAHDWKALIDEELKKRGPEAPAEEWFHTIIYCIAVGSARVEPYEEMLLHAFQQEKYRILVALTKADQANDGDTEALKKIIKDIGAEAVPLCCVEKKTFAGQTKKFGLEEFKRTIYDNFWKTLIDRLPRRCIHLIHNQIDEWEKDVRQSLKIIRLTKNLGINPPDTDYFKFVKKSCTDFLETLKDSGPSSIKQIVFNETRRTMDVFVGFSYAYAEKDISFAAILERELVPKIETLLEQNDTFWDTIKPIVFRMFPLIETINNLFKGEKDSDRLIQSLCGELKSSISKQEHEIKNAIENFLSPYFTDDWESPKPVKH